MRGQRVHSGGGRGTLQGPVRPAAVYRGVSVFHSLSMRGGGGDGVKPAVCVFVCALGRGACSNIGKGLLEHACEGSRLFTGQLPPLSSYQCS